MYYNRDVALFGRKKLGRLRKTRTEESFSRQIFRGLMRLAILGVVLTSVWYFTRLEFFTINEVTVTGGETIAHDDLRTRLTSELEGEYFLFVPKRFSYLYPHERMMEVLLTTPRIKSGDITRESRNTLTVSFEEYVPAALWCTKGPNEPCLFLDESGFAFAEAPLLQGGGLIRHTVEGKPAEPGTQVIEGSVLTNIHGFIQRIEHEHGLRVTALTHKENGDIEFEVNGGGQIFASGGKDLHVTFENLTSVLTSPEYEHIAPGNFNYIDVRFDKKVFLNEEFATTPAATTTEKTEDELEEELSE